MAMPDAVDRKAQKLQKIARLYRGATSPGERLAAEAAFNRVRLGTPYATISINSFNLRSCGCAILTCKHWRARCAPLKTPEQEAIERLGRETRATILEVISWDAKWNELAPFYIYNIAWGLPRSSLPRMSEREIEFLRDFGWELRVRQRAPTGAEMERLSACVTRMRELEVIRQDWAAKLARKRAAAAYARSFRWKQRGSKLQTATGV